MALDFATIVQEPQLAVLAALETTAEAARFVLISHHRDLFETGLRADAVQNAQTAGELVEQLESLMDTIGRYRAQVLDPDYRQRF